MADIEVPVLIVGSSLVGMSTALLLGHHGIPRSRSSITAARPSIRARRRSPSARWRSCACVGIEQIVRQKSDEQFVQDGAIMAVETLAGKELGYFIANLNEGVRDVSPCERVFISQSLLEPLLKTRADELGAELRFATDLVSFEQHDGPRPRGDPRTATPTRPTTSTRGTWWRPTARTAVSASTLGIRMQRPRRVLAQRDDLFPRRRHAGCCAAAT